MSFKGAEFSDKVIKLEIDLIFWSTKVSLKSKVFKSFIHEIIKLISFPAPQNKN
jgi:hypothetical protein